MTKTTEAFRTISEVAEDLDIPKHVLRFWEVKFPQIRPMKRGGGRRYYRPEDLELLRGIRHLLHAEGYTIKGVQKILREHGVNQVKTQGRDTPPPPEAAPARRGRPQAAAGQSRQSAAASPVRAGRSGQTPAPTVARTALLAAIAELDECRRLLRDEQPAAALPASPVRRQAKARQTRA